MKSRFGSLAWCAFLLQMVSDIVKLILESQSGGYEPNGTKTIRTKKL